MNPLRLFRRRQEPPSATPLDDALLDAIDDPLLVLHRRVVVRANEAARRLLGPHIVGEDARVTLRHPDAAAALGRAPERVRGIALGALGGREGRWEMDLTPLGADDRLIHLVDHSEAQAAERMRVDFVANASHELRTPLATLLGFVETLGDDGIDAATRRRFLAIMLGEARRMQQLVEDLISLSRIEGERHRLPATPIDLAALASRVAEEIRVAAGVPADTFRLASDGSATVAGDDGQIVQLLHNILGNALKYRRPDTPIEVTVAHADGSVRLRVADQGDGIAAQHLPRLTERFYRVDASRSRQVGGTGLGLAIVKHIVERHRGRLDIASEVGVGTTVSVTLPAAVSQNRHDIVTQLEGETGDTSNA